MRHHWLYFLLLLWSFAKASTERRENEETQKKKTEMSHPTMAPNSKFLNPHVDDETNLQFAVAAFGDEGKAPEGGKASGILSKLAETWGFDVSKKAAKSSEDWRLIPYLNSLIRRTDTYKLKKF